MDIFNLANSIIAMVEPLMNKLVIALLIVLVGIIIARITDRFLHKILLRSDFDKKCYVLFKQRRHYTRGTRKIVSYLLYVISVYFSLVELGIAWYVEVALVVLFGLISAVSLLLAIIDFIPNFFASRTIRTKYLTGDVITVLDSTGKLSGKITHMTHNDLCLSCENGDIIYLPMRVCVESKITKHRSAQ